MVDRLQTPYSPRILRAVREGLARPGTPRERVDHLIDLADWRTRPSGSAPEPLPPVTEDDVRLVCWIAIA
ncbi:hypothetical protein LDL08_39000 [Nonomuraea glycinis]|uniref:Uncharacterized protein n=1 Tax=Nonomuraea glycinis TaxID=2047744 RepID=A0A918A359_9ACTN|nr:hypothetical protein [Nonomuraea glycinis]MCA2182164.1 hypothetical protein [Nonomuraea glycinis]GGP02163.1 hypothetical protein GCM10012278_08300 [Nonomuraea glycinis]